jgi:hypothetical protein
MNRLFIALLFAGSMLPAAHANVIYSFSVDTSGISSLAPSGGYLDFEFNQVNSLNSLSATATINGFSSTGYSFNGTVLTSSGVTGALPGPIAIPNDQGGANFFTQGLDTFGSSFSFSVELSGPALGTAAPDGSNFFLFLLDPGFNQIVSPATLEGEILNVTLDTNGDTIPEGSVFNGGSAGWVVTPEPGSAWFCLAAGLFALGAISRGNMVRLARWVSCQGQYGTTKP